MKYALNKPVCFQGMPHCSVPHPHLLFKGGRQVRCKRLWDVVGNDFPLLPTPQPLEPRKVAAQGLLVDKRGTS